MIKMGQFNHHIWVNVIDSEHTYFDAASVSVTDPHENSSENTTYYSKNGNHYNHSRRNGLRGSGNLGLTEEKVYQQDVTKERSRGNFTFKYIIYIEGPRNVTMK